MSNDCGAKTIETQEMSGRRNDLYRMKGMDVKLLCVAKKKGESRGVRKEESKESGCPESETNRLHLRGRLQGTMVMRVYIEIQLDTHTCMHTRSVFSHVSFVMFSMAVGCWSRQSMKRDWQ